MFDGMDDESSVDGENANGWRVFLTLRGREGVDVEEAAATLVSSDLGGTVQPPGGGAAGTSLGAIVDVGPMSQEDACSLVAERATTVLGDEWSVDTRAERLQETRGTG